MITKDTISEILNIDEDNISDSVFNWAQKQFFVLTGLNETDEAKSKTRFINAQTLLFPLYDDNIKSVDSLEIDGESTEFTLYSDLTFNPETGLVKYNGGFSGGQLIKVSYTKAGYIHKDIHDYLVSLLVIKSLTIFTPEEVNQVRMVKIGKFQKQFGSAAANLNEYVKALDSEIKMVINLINGDDGSMRLGQVI